MVFFFALPTQALDQWLDRSICTRFARIDCPKWRHLSALSRQKVASVSRFVPRTDTHCDLAAGHMLLLAR